jgi:hypothetical protein
LIFGSIGLAAFVYGKITMQAKKMIYPYLTSDAWLLWGIGAALTACLLNWKN